MTKRAPIELGLLHSLAVFAAVGLLILAPVIGFLAMASLVSDCVISRKRAEDGRLSELLALVGMVGHLGFALGGLLDIAAVTTLAAKTAHPLGATPARLIAGAAFFTAALALGAGIEHGRERLGPLVERSATQRETTC